MSDDLQKRLAKEGRHHEVAVSGRQGERTLSVPTEAGDEFLRQVLADRVKAARMELGLSQAALAEAYGRSPSWIAEIERGRQAPPHALLASLATTLARPMDWFYDWREARPQNPLDTIRENVQRAVFLLQEVQPLVTVTETALGKRRKGQ